MTHASKSVYEPGSSAVTGASGSASGVMRNLPLVILVNSLSNLSSGSSNVSTTLLMMSAGMVQAWDGPRAQNQTVEAKIPTLIMCGLGSTRGTWRGSMTV